MKDRSDGDELAARIGDGRIGAYRPVGSFEAAGHVTGEFNADRGAEECVMKVYARYRGES